MATFRLQRIDLGEERLFSKRGKVRRDKRVAYNLAQQRKANQQKLTTIPKPVVSSTSSSPVQQSQPTSVPPAGSTLQLNPSDFQQSSVMSNNNSTLQTGGNNKQNTSQPQTNTTTSSGSTNSQSSTTTKPLPNIKPENVVIGQQPTGQQGTTGSVNWGQLGKSAFGKAKPILKGAALTAGVLAAGTLAGTALMANKVGKAVSEGAENIGDRLEENRRWRREEKMAKRLIKAGYNPYQEGQRIGGYAFTAPRYYR